MRILILSLFMILPSLVFAQGTPQYNFDLANEHLANKEYESAKALYLSILNSENESGAVYVNLGIIAVQEDSLGLAKCYFMQASDFVQTELQAESGLNFVESRFSRQSAVLPLLPWERFFNWLREVFGANGLFLISAIFANIAALLIVYSWFNRASTKALFRGGAGLFVASMIVVCLAFYVDYLSGRFGSAVLIDEQAEVMEKADDDSNLVSLAYEGYAFTVDRKTSQNVEGWTYIRMSNGLYGWVKSNTIKTL